MRQLSFPRATTRRRETGRGGWRRNAGRKPNGAKAGQSHLRREQWAGLRPVHVTWRVVAGVPSLRSRRAFRVIQKALSVAAARFEMTIVEFSVQSNHVHLVIEAIGQQHMSHGMQALGVRLGKGLNRVFARKGRLMSERFHAHVLRNRIEATNAVRYVRTNHLHHRGIHDARVRAVAASMFPRPHGDSLTTNHLGHGVPLRFARSRLLVTAVNALAIPP